MNREIVNVIAKNKQNGMMISSRVKFVDLIAYWFSEMNEEHGNMNNFQLEATAGESDPEGDVTALINRGRTTIMNSDWYSALAFEYTDACELFVELEMDESAMVGVQDDG